MPMTARQELKYRQTRGEYMIENWMSSVRFAKKVVLVIVIESNAIVQYNKIHIRRSGGEVSILSIYTSI